MHQRELLEETKDFLRVSKKKQRGIKFHEKYSQNIIPITVILFLGSIIHGYYFGYSTVIIYSVLVLCIVIIVEIIFKKYYKFTGRDAVKYYALKTYENPTRHNLNELHSWNKNPFNLLSEYYYPQINRVVAEAYEQDNPTEYFQKEIPDVLRLIERQERSDYNTLVDVANIDIELDTEYMNMIQEANYSYKFGGYMSVSVILRKITENLIVDILMSKGLYTELPDEPEFPEMVEFFANTVLRERMGEDLSEDFIESVDVWIRKKGNKGAHKREEFTTEEVEELMDHAQRAIRLLLVIKSESETDYEPKNASESQADSDIEDDI